jgi:hypothetical protein
MRLRWVAQRPQGGGPAGHIAASCLVSDYKADENPVR